MRHKLDFVCNRLFKMGVEHNKKRLELGEGTEMGKAEAHITHALVNLSADLRLDPDGNRHLENDTVEEIDLKDFPKESKGGRGSFIDDEYPPPPPPEGYY